MIHQDQEATTTSYPYVFVLNITWKRVTEQSRDAGRGHYLSMQREHVAENGLSAASGDPSTSG